uniref:Soluble scavenger receptor cysteine-rich domain-containing protein SSC5D n=1 Tax=Homo sapiens TaxID=9606 RepID=B4DI70_HUMAN|nr:unnamed protein product [Homo sapiens]
MTPPRLFWVWLLVAGTQGVNDGDMRLADGGATNQGRVEIFYRGQWGTVCDNLWDLTDASVVCRALGFENATQALGRAAFGQGSGPIMPLDLYAYAVATGDALLEKLCLQFLAWNFEALTQAEAWPSVPTDLLQLLLPRSDLAVPSELALLKAVDTWSWGERASHEEVEGLVEKIRFPMMLPEELFELQFNLSLYWSHEALFQKKTLQALEFHTVPFQLLARYKGLNLTEDTYKPRIYTSPTWSAFVTDSSWSARKSQLVYQSRRGPLVKYSSDYFQAPSDYRYYPYQSFQTPQHPSFLFQDKRVSWSLVYLPTIQSCWNYGFSCSSDELPVLGLTKSGGSDRTIAYENKALMLCEGLFVADVTDFEGWKAAIPSALDTNSSKSTSSFPCPAGHFNGFRTVIRPFYLTNSSGVD